MTLTQTFSQLWRGKLMGNPRDFSTAVQQLAPLSPAFSRAFDAAVVGLHPER